MRTKGRGLPALLTIGLLLLAPLAAATGGSAAATTSAASGHRQPASRASATAAAPLPDLHVNNAPCLSGADGSAAKPYCTIALALAAVSPGQTIRVAPNSYVEYVAITKSGTPGAPITLAADASPGPLVRVAAGGPNTAATPEVTLQGVHDVVLQGFDVTNVKAGPAILVDGSTDITIDAGRAVASAAPAIQVSGGSSNVTISRNVLSGKPSLAVDGSSDTVVSSNSLPPVLTPTQLTVNDSPGTVLTSNTVVGACRAGIALTGTSTGSSLVNNVLDPALGGGSHPTACATPDAATAVSVDATATSGTTASSNVVDPIGGGAAYSWGGTAYTDLTAFQAATGQGQQDRWSDPSLVAQASGVYSLQLSSPAIDSADVNAPGELTTDLFDNARSDDPSVANSGGGYADRGARELVAVSGPGGTLTGAASGSPLSAVATATRTSTWTTTGPVGLFAYQLNGRTIYTRDTSVTTTFDQAGRQCFGVYLSTNAFRETARTGSSGICTVLGAGYTPTTPTRVLDTRARVGVATTTPVPAGGQVAVPLSSIAGVPAAKISAVVVNLTATAATSTGYLRLNSSTVSSSLNYTPGTTTANLAVVPLAPGGLVVDNLSRGSVQVVADIEGIFVDDLHGVRQVTPTRVLDTRAAVGWGGRTPVPAGGSVALDLSSAVPAGSTAAIVTLTATGATRGGYLTAYPDGVARPTASTLNFRAGQVVANLAIVPLSSARGVVVYNGSAGATHVVADLVGFVGTRAAGATSVYVPYPGVRVLDSRNTATTGAASPLPPRSTFGPIALSSFGGCAPTCPLPTGGFLNLTVTGARAPGYLTAYQWGTARPTASAMNFEAGRTRAGLALGFALTDVYLGTGGTLDLLADEQGYLIAGPAS